MNSEPVSFIAACREYFGLHKDQTNLGFGKEIQALTPADRVEITQGLVSIGYNIK